MSDLVQIRSAHEEHLRMLHGDPPGRARREIGFLLSEIDRRDAILRRLAAVSEPITEATYSMLDSRVCVLCDEHPDDHAEDCPWRQARELLGERDGESTN